MSPVVSLRTLHAAIANRSLRQRDWGNGQTTFCMMSALVPGAESTSDCAMAGWPTWVVRVNIFLFDTGEYESAVQFAWGAATEYQKLKNKEDFERLRIIFQRNLIKLVVNRYKGYGVDEPLDRFEKASLGTNPWDSAILLSSARTIPIMLEADTRTKAQLEYWMRYASDSIGTKYVDFVEISVELLKLAADKGGVRPLSSLGLAVYQVRECLIQSLKEITQ